MILLYMFLVLVIVVALRAMLHKTFIKPKLLLRKGRKSYLYFHLNPHAGKIKYGFAANPGDRFKTHLTSNEDLIPIVVFPELEGFNETILKAHYNGDEQVAIDDDIIRVIETGSMSHLKKRR